MWLFRYVLSLSYLSYLWDLEEWRGGESFKVIIWGDNASHKGGGGNFNGKGGSHYLILLYWNFIVCLTGYCKRFYRIPLFPIFLLSYLFCIYWVWQGQKCKLKCPKIYEVISELTVISAWTHSRDTSAFTHNLTRIDLLQLKIHDIWMKFFWNPFRHNSTLKS